MQNEHVEYVIQKDQYSTEFNNDGAYYIGLMSGTSLDGVDGVLVRFPNYSSFAKAPKASKASNKPAENTQNAACSTSPVELIAKTSMAFSDAFKQTLLTLQTPQHNELHLASLASNQLVQSYYEPCVQNLLHQAKIAATSVKAIAAHGQTIRHQPQMHDGLGYTLQLNQPALLAARTNIPVVSDFRVADLYRGGQAAPLVPIFHQYLVDCALKECANSAAITTTLFCNIGGMSNISVLQTNSAPIGFDCGPGNVLMDTWIQVHQGLPYDKQGNWARSGQAIPELLSIYLEHPYFSQAFPKSTGREIFNLAYIENGLQIYCQRHAIAFNALLLEDVQSTLIEVTVHAISSAIAFAIEHNRQVQQAINVQPTAAVISQQMPIHIYFCGGGAFNDYLQERLSAKLLPSKYALCTSDALGIAAQDMEATAFAWLGKMRIEQQFLKLMSITGASTPAVLGAIYL